MAETLKIITPSPNQVMPLWVLTGGIPWKWKADHRFWGYIGEEYVTPNAGIPHRYIGKIKMVIRDEQGSEIYSHTYDCDDSTDFYNNQPGMNFYPQTGCISATAGDGGQDFGMMSYWDPPKDKFKAGERYYLQGEVETITDFDGGQLWCTTGSECTDMHPGGSPMTLQCWDYVDTLSDCNTGPSTDVLYNNADENEWGIPFEIEAEILGCTEPTAENWNPDANKDDGSCKTEEEEEGEEKPWPEANVESNEEEPMEEPPPAPDEEVPVQETAISPTPAVGNVSNRVFGADMSLAVKRKLEVRQYLNQGNRNPNDPITTMYRSENPPQSDTAEAYSINDPVLGTNLQFGGDADLSSRTPFARMWTAVQLQKVINKRNWHKNEDKNYERNPDFRYESRNNRVWEKEIHRHERMVYMVGDANSNIFEKSPTQQRDLKDGSQGAVGGGLASKLLPYEGESNNNEYMKPPAGITAVSSETEGPLGAIRKTSVEFTVHNFHDFENIYSRYFLRPGAMVYIDFGWSSSALYDPKELVFDEHGNSDTLEEKLYGPDGVITKTAGDAETFMGYVVDYSAKATENGSFECSLEIVSKNQALLGHSYKETKHTKTKMVAALDASIINFAAKHFGDAFLKADQAYSTDSTKFKNDIAWLWASEQLKGDGNPSSKEALMTGVFWKKLKEMDSETGKLKEVPADTKNIYISWGLVEDMIFNDELAIATDPDDAIHGKNLTVRFDSSNTFVHWDKNLSLMMKEDKSTPFKFMYPRKWNETFNTIRGKVPFDRLKPNGKAEMRVSGANLEKYGTVGTKKNAKPWYMVDRDDHQRIPLREIFVSLAHVKDGLNKKETINDIINYIIEGINEESRGIYDLKLSSNKKHMSESSIVDRNFIYSERMDEYDYLDKLFVFQPHSDNSIVTDFGVNFSMPSNNMNSMIAIGNADAGTQIFPADSAVDKALAMNIQKYVGEDVSLGVTYLPEVGNHRVNKYQKSLSEGMILDAGFFDAGEMLMGEDDSSNELLSNFTLAYKNKDEWKETLEAEENFIEEQGKESADSDKGETTESATKESEEYGDDVQLASSLSDFYALKAQANYFTEKVSTVIPIEVELSIYGIGSINVGDLFRVDYLPKLYRESVYFQTTKVSHDLDTTGWITKLTSQMRISPTAKRKFPLYQQPKIYLSRKALEHHKLLTEGRYYDMGSSTNLKWNTSPLEWMREIELVKKRGPNIPSVLKGVYKFVATRNENIKAPFKISKKRIVTAAMPWQIEDEYKSISWKLTGKDSFKMWREGPVKGSAGASGAFAVWNNYALWYKINLKEGNQYKLIISMCGGWMICPYDTTDDQIDLIDQGFWCMNRRTNDNGDYNVPRAGIARRVSE